MALVPQIYCGGIAETNAYLLATPHGSHVLIDAPEGVTAWLQKLGIVPTHLLLTHQHFDHVMDAAAVRALGAQVHAFADHDPALTLETMARSWGMPDVKAFQVDHKIEPHLPLEIDGLHFSLAHVPGHSPDSITFYLEQGEELFSGDTLFEESIGRTDIPGHGDQALLIAGIRAKLLTLPQHTKVYPGHGRATDIGHEIRMNPYL